MEHLERGHCQPGVGYGPTDVGLIDENGTGTEDEGTGSSAETPGRQRRGSRPSAAPSPDLPPGSAQLCSPGLQRGGSPRVPFTPHGILGVHVPGFGSRRASPRLRASAMCPRLLRRQRAASRIADASGGCTRTEPTASPRSTEGGRGRGSQGPIAPPLVSTRNFHAPTLSKNPHPFSILHWSQNICNPDSLAPVALGPPLQSWRHPNSLHPGLLIDRRLSPDPTPSCAPTPGRESEGLLSPQIGPSADCLPHISPIT